MKEIITTYICGSYIFITSMGLKYSITQLCFSYVLIISFDVLLSTVSNYKDERKEERKKPQNQLKLSQFV